MGDESIWKKEISFRRRPKEQKEAEVESVEATDGEKPSSIWKKEISLKRKPKEKTAEHDEGEKPSSIWKKELSLKRKAAAEEPADVVEEPETPVIERVVSFTRDVQRRPGSEPAVAEELVAEEPVAEEHVEGTGTEPDPEETDWKKEVSFSPKAEVEEPAAEEPVATEPIAEAPAEDDSVWKKEVSFSRKPEAEKPAAEEPVATEPVAEAPAEDDSVWKKEVSFSRKPEAAEPIPEEPVAEELEPTAPETWSAGPELPPAPEPEPVTVPEPAPGIHPPVPAAELPPLKDMGETKGVPFWKKEISFGGGKKREQAPKQPKERKQKALKAERAPKVKEPKQPKAPRVKRERSSSKGGKRVVGLKIGASQLAAARVSNNGTAELQQVARQPLPAGIVVGGELRDPDALAEALKEFFNKNGLPKKGVRLGIANNRIGVRTFEIAGIDDSKQLGNAIRFRAQEALPIPIDEAVLDYHVIGEGKDEEGQTTKRILLVVAYRELIDRYVDACKKAGIVLSGIDLEAFALLRALAAPQDGVGSDPTAALVAVAIGHERSTFAVSDGRVCEFTRVLEWGGSALNVAIARVLDAAPSEVEGAKRALALTDEMVPDGLTSEQAKKAREAMRRAIQTFAR